MLQAGEPFMMLNVDHEAFASASGSIACESLPPELKKEYEEGEHDANNGLLRLCEMPSWIGPFRVFGGCSNTTHCTRNSKASTNVWRCVLAN